MSITAIINCYRRPKALEAQYKAIKDQSIEPQDIFIWQNFYPETSNLFSPEILSNCKSCVSNYNWGVWARFALALNAKTKYICIFDDDTIPGKLWFDNCLETISKNNGLLGTRGVIFGANGNYFENRAVGWETKNENVEKVDIVGHAWFFEREWLKAYFAELPPIEIMPQCAGEDMHMSFAIQKHFSLSTYVPPHPEDNKEMWGSLRACELGIGREATANFAMPQMNQYLQYIRSKGFKLINDSK
jgi:hypothetical protein